MSFLKNVWYMAGWSDELVDGALLGRTIAKEQIAFFRNSAGELQAVSDRCPHRFIPLSAGKVIGDSVQCPYHGLQFDGTGKCTHNPHGNGAIPKAACVRSFPAVEKYMALWVWLGDPAQADVEKVPDVSFVEQAKPSARGKGYLYSRCNYELLADNIMDLSHVDYLHPTTLGGGALSKTPAKVEEMPGNRVKITWLTHNDAAPPAFAPHLEKPAEASVWAEVVWHAPAVMVLSSGAYPAGGKREDGPHTLNFHIMTPQDEVNTHYFFANTRSFVQDDPEFNAFVQSMLLNVFTNEDKPMVEAQQRAVGDSDILSLSPVLLTIDAGAVRCRRMLRQMIEAEKSEA